MRLDALLFWAATGCTTDSWCDRLNLDCDTTTIDEHDIVDQDGDVWQSDQDCDDANAAAHPGHPELCDGIDNDCDGLIDEGVSIRAAPDRDGDGFGAAERAASYCDAPPAGYVLLVTDCDDQDPATHPDATETCGDGIDNDCDAQTDETLGVTAYADADGDGFGDPASSQPMCDGETAGWVADHSDCDDGTLLRRPDLAERCGDGLDNDCDNVIDEAGCTEMPACPDGGWAGYADPNAVVWVSEAGADDGDGTLWAPLSSLRDAMERIRDVPDAQIGLLPGTYGNRGDQNLRLGRPSGAPLTVAGCSAESVFIQQMAHRAPGLSIHGPGPVGLRGVTIRTGETGLAITGGADAAVQDIVIDGPSVTALKVVGADTRAVVDGVLVQNIAGSVYRRQPQGWGVSVVEADLSLRNAEIVGVRGFGVYVNGGAIDADGVVVRQTLANRAGHGGIGVYVNQAQRASLVDVTVEDPAGGGIFVVDTPSVSIEGCVVSGTGQTQTAPGDGVTIRRVGSSGHAHTAAVADCTVTGAARMGVVVSGAVSVTLDAISAGTDNGLHDGHSAVFVSAGADARGSASWSSLDESLRLGRAYGATKRR